MLTYVTSEAEGRASSTENKGKSWVWAARRPWSRFWEAYISGTESPIDKQSSLVGTPIPSTVYGTNAESYKYPLWHVARGARGVSKIFRLLFFGNGWADCAEILYAIGVPLVTAYAVFTGGISLQCARAEIPPIQRFCISETAWPIVFKFCMWVGGHQQGAFHKSLVEYICMCVRAHPFPINVPLAVTR